jgi:hypothetical protein
MSAPLPGMTRLPGLRERSFWHNAWVRIENAVRQKHWHASFLKRQAKSSATPHCQSWGHDINIERFLPTLLHKPAWELIPPSTRDWNSSILVTNVPSSNAVCCCFFALYKWIEDLRINHVNFRALMQTSPSSNSSSVICGSSSLSLPSSSSVASPSSPTVAGASSFALVNIHFQAHAIIRLNFLQKSSLSISSASTACLTTLPVAAAVSATATSKR